MPSVTHGPVYTALRLAPTFDAERLRADLAGLSDTDWIPHFNAGYHDGGWSGFPLRAAAGSSNPLYPDPSQNHFEDLPVLAHFPTVRSVIASFQCPLRAVRLLKLRAGSVIREHRDDGLGYEQGEVRLHIPIVTNPEMTFYLEGERVPMAPGETWYVNVSLPHRVRNSGTTDRIHLVIDCRVNDWVRALFAAGQHFERARAVSSVQPLSHLPVSQHLDAFRQCVWEDSALQARLCDTEDGELFVRQVMASAQERGYRLSADAVREALQEARRSWNERNIIR